MKAVKKVNKKNAKKRQKKNVFSKKLKYYLTPLGALMAVLTTLAFVWGSQKTELLASLTFNQLQLGSSIKLTALEDARNIINDQNNEVITIQLQYPIEDGSRTRNIQIPLDETGFQFELDESSFQAIQLESTTPFFQDGSLKGAAEEVINENIANLQLDHDQWKTFTERLRDWITRESISPKITWNKNRGWTLLEKQHGRMITEETFSKIQNLLSRQLRHGSAPEKITIPILASYGDVDFGEAEALEQQFEVIQALIKEPLSITIQEEQYFLDLNSREEIIFIDENGVSLNKKVVMPWIQDLSENVHRPSNTIRITGKEEVRYGATKAITEGEFLEGRRIVPEEVWQALLETFNALKKDAEASREVPVRVYEIPLKVYSEIEETEYDIIAVGYSEYSEGNASYRVHNIETGLKRINGSLIEPGAEISFNTLNGVINHEFEYGYAILGGGSGLSLGGGICQVSTTFYRSLLNAGVPITMRKNHSWDLSYYRAGGYGLDATIYPSTGLDVKAINNFDSDLFLYAYNRPETEEVFVLLYGKDDGRQVTLEPHEEYIPYYGAKTLKWTQTIDFPDGRVEQNSIVSRYSQ